MRFNFNIQTEMLKYKSTSHIRQFLINLSIQECLLVARKRGLESLFHKCANWNHG